MRIVLLIVFSQRCAGQIKARGGTQDKDIRGILYCLARGSSEAVEFTGTDTVDVATEDTCESSTQATHRHQTQDSALDGGV